jgi:DNA processing protein
MTQQRSIEELMYLIAFSKMKNIPDTIKKEQLIQFNSAKILFDFCQQDPVLKKLYWPLDLARREIEFIVKHQIQTHSLVDHSYPNRLIHCEDAPIILYQKGKGDFQVPYIISIVGTRAHTRQAFTIINELIEGLQHLNIAIISGLALGIDSIAHQTCLNNKIPTWAVLGHGLDQIYPTQNRKMAIAILEQGGLLTEFTHQTSPMQFHFPKRNRIVAGMADATLVVETDTKGGSMITATHAFKYNREVFAAPGKIHDPKSRGCLALIKNNIAHVYHDPLHFLEAMQWPTPPKAKAMIKNQQISIQWDEIAKQIIEFIDIHSPVNEESIFEHFSMEPSILNAKLLDLELDGAIERQAGNQYTRKID